MVELRAPHTEVNVPEQAAQVRFQHEAPFLPYDSPLSRSWFLALSAVLSFQNKGVREQKTVQNNKNKELGSKMV